MTALLEWVLGTTIDRRVKERTRELTAESVRVATALRGSNIHIFFQDRDLRYRSVISPNEGAKQLVGRTDEQILPSTERDTVIAAKRNVIATGKPADCEVSLVTPDGAAVYALHVEPMLGQDNVVEGVCCSAVELTRVRLLEREQRRLSDELQTMLQRYELAMRGSNITVFTQDRDLRYISISHPVGDLTVEEIIGHTDDDILNEPTCADVVAFKQACLESGSPKDGEIGVGFKSGTLRWFDLHIEPLRTVTGEVTGLVGAAVDITKRKDDEAHLRLLMRELTHRSKNLLAVIQAMARQTARHSNSIEAFVAQFDARLQGLATSHDVLIEEGWHGASLEGLIKLQLQPFIEERAAQVVIEGPTVLLKPDSAQALGMALHELGTNARRYGALSNSNGRIAITWRRLPLPEGDGVEIKWSESGGPAIDEPVSRHFGSMIIERNLEQAIGGKVRLLFPASGVQCDILIPAMHLVGFVERSGI